ncbi:hypothetical protein OKA04_04530 [Luteolibacter flavescens]|uniref:Uncharacterized protein n=1 Tax=Luteolibacter flavescens TaxID=1859460 RepID=A0ABT3FK85_9BACT|nr:hypothetical protein [Luteolibacter flavescens]MCW1883982.1 hypothetical protein [Luteolibacter flavescens]
MATTRKAHKKAAITASIHRRVDAQTPTPYLAQLINNGGKPTQIIVMVTEIVTPLQLPGMPVPPFGRATVMSNGQTMHYRRGEVVRVDNFNCLRRLEITEIADS